MVFFFSPEIVLALNNNDKNKHTGFSGTWKLIFKHFLMIGYEVFFNFRCIVIIVFIVVFYCNADL